MKKLKLNLQQFEGAEVLTRSQLKKILGGDGGSGGEGKYKCCPKGDCNSSACSTCVTVPKGSHADCSANSNAEVCSC